MKDMMINLFHKPKVLFMLMIICLALPAQTIQTIQACPPPDCSAELEALEEAKAELNRAHAKLEETNQSLIAAYSLVGHFGRKLDEAKRNHNEALKALKACLKLKIGTCLKALLLLWRAWLRLDNAKNSYNNALRILANANDAYDAAYLEADTAYESYRAALDAYNNCVRG